MARRALEPLLLACAFGLLCAWSWMRWPDLRLDYGDELYLPWRILQGEVLYRDLGHLYGPLTKYLQALTFALFGVGLRTAVLFNLAVLAGTAALLRHLLRAAAGPAAALWGPLAFLAAFAFSQYGMIGNFNWVCPYRAEVVHGTVLGLGALALLGRHLRGGGRAPLLLAGLCLGGVLLTKPELTIAAFGAAGVLAGLAAWHARSLRAPALLLAPVPLPPLLAWLGLRRAGLGWGEALRGTFNAFMPLIEGKATKVPFFRTSAGLDQPLLRLGEMARGLLGIGVVLGALALLDVALARLPRGRRAAQGALLALLALLAPALGWDLAARALTLLCAGAALALAALALRAAPEVRATTAFRAGLAAYALLMLTKMGLWPRVEHFGFVLVAPAALLLIALATEALPAALARSGPGRGGFARAGAAVLVLGFCAAELLAANEIYRHKNLWVGHGADRLRAYDPDFIDVDQKVAQALDAVEARVPPGATLAVIPEGIMLNYLLRRPTPTRYTVLTTTELRAYGEETILAAYQARPPEWVLLLTRDSDEMAVGRFGQDPLYGQKLMRWVYASYEERWGVGDDPFLGEAIGLRLLERRR